MRCFIFLDTFSS